MAPLMPVESSNIKAVGYDEATKTLTVQFLSGQTWSYADVPPKTYRELMDADSVGGYFSREIRNDFDGTRAAEDDDPFR
jgi:hypothetical protein